jgi:hypothetical protein
MATKAETLAQAARGEGCLGKAADDEPVFVLRAKDPAAVLAVRIWCSIALALGAHEPEKIADAEVEASRMQCWRDAQGQASRLRSGGGEADDD